MQNFPDEWSGDWSAASFGLPPLDDTELPAEPPPEADLIEGVWLGSPLTGGLPGFARADDSPVDAVEAALRGFAQVHPGLVGLAELGSLDFESMTQTHRVDAILSLERRRCWLDALQQQLLASVSAHDESEQKWSREELGAALRIAPLVAAGRIATAETLCGSLPATLASLGQGLINSAQATAIADSARKLPESMHVELEAQVLSRAEVQTAGQLRQSLRRAVIRLHPDGAAERHRAARAERQVRVSDADDGMAWLSALLPAAEAQACMARIDRAAGTATGVDTYSAEHLGQSDERSLQQRRADSLIDLILGAKSITPNADTPHAASGIGTGTRTGTGIPTNTGIPTGTGTGTEPARPVADIGVLIGLETLIGLNDDPAWLDGHGPITAEVARRLAHEGTSTWHRLVTDPVHGQLLEYGRTRYAPPPSLREHVLARDGTCTFPTCQAAAARSDLDHIVPFPIGPTNPANLHAAHRRHHNAKTHGGWRVHRDPDTGVTTWTSPQGRAYPSEPPARWSTQTAR
jgi:hypothetical protein